MKQKISQAVILVGGFGTRLLPLTKTRPKPAMPVLDKPFIMYLIESLAEAGVNDIILACGYKSELISASIEPYSPDGVRIRYVDEDEPLGTAGAIKNVEDLLDEAFVVANGDTLNFVDVSAQLDAHIRYGADVTLSLSEVEDPSSSGVVLMDDSNRILRFQEKPKKEEALSNTVNTGLYVFNRSVLRYIPKGKFFDASKDLFPELLADGVGMYGHMADGIWIDIGKPKDLIHMNQVMSGVLYPDEDWSVHMHGGTVSGRSYIGAGSAVEDTEIRDGIISESCRVSSSRVENSYIMKGSIVDGATVLDSVIGEGCTIGRGVIVKDTVLGDGTVLPQSDRGL